MCSLGKLLCILQNLSGTTFFKWLPQTELVVLSSESAAARHQALCRAVVRGTDREGDSGQCGLSSVDNNLGAS